MEECFSHLINIIAHICISLKDFFVKNITNITGMIGASAWFAPWVYQRFTRPSIKGQLISFNQNGGTFMGKECIMHFMALNIISLNKESNIDMTKTKISVKYRDDKKNYPCKQFWARCNQWVTAEGETFDLKIFPEQTLLYTSSLPKDTAIKVYVLFKDEASGNARSVEEISISLFDYANKKSELVFNKFDMDEEKIVWDDRIWIPKNSMKW